MVRVRPPCMPVAEALLAQDWVLSADPLDEHRLRVTVRSLAEAELHLPAALAACRARMVSLLPQAADLEDVFLELTS
ncbi:MAG: hypothetical protein HOV83_26400 [Catenulispora sp.]|nr:hypothetical protein [Catenulispora sp.]